MASFVRRHCSDNLGVVSGDRFDSHYVCPGVVIRKTVKGHHWPRLRACRDVSEWRLLLCRSSGAQRSPDLRASALHHSVHLCRAVSVLAVLYLIGLAIRLQQQHFVSLEGFNEA
eukprot:5973347-Amphidinium_carterae.1